MQEYAGVLSIPREIIRAYGPLPQMAAQVQLISVRGAPCEPGDFVCCMRHVGRESRLHRALIQAVCRS